jgi:hypothetical protein
LRSAEGGGTTIDQCGSGPSFGAGCPNGIVASFTNQGSIPWTQSYTGFTPEVGDVVAWPDGGVSAIVATYVPSYQDAGTGPTIQGEGISATGSAGFLVKWNADGSFAWSLSIPVNAAVTASALLSSGNIMIAVDVTSSVPLGTFTLRANTNSLVTVSPTGTPTAAVTWTDDTYLLRALPSGGVLVAGATGCENDYNCENQYIASVSSAGVQQWRQALDGQPDTAQSGGYPYIGDMTAGADGLVYFPFYGSASAYNNVSEYYPSMGGTTVTCSDGTSGCYYGIVGSIKL